MIMHVMLCYPVGEMESVKIRMATVTDCEELERLIKVQHFEFTSVLFFIGNYFFRPEGQQWSSKAWVLSDLGPDLIFQHDQGGPHVREKHIIYVAYI